METLNDIRNIKNIPLSDVAKQLHFSESYCSLILNGKRSLELDVAKKIADMFELTIDELFLYYNFAKRKEKDGA